MIVVMPDGGQAGWYSNPVGSFVGPRNWETFHIAQLIPWIEANFRTFAEYDGRAVGGFSMGGFGALKYAAKYYGHFASVSSHSGPASLRRDSGLVVHWANLSSAVVELGGATVYGVPWDEARVSADNPVELIDSYRNKRIFLVAGTSPDPVNWFDSVQETQVLAGQREFRERPKRAGIPHEAHEEPGGHVFRPDMFHPRPRRHHRPAATGGSAAAVTRTTFGAMSLAGGLTSAERNVCSCNVAARRFWSPGIGERSRHPVLQVRTVDRRPGLARGCAAR